jgi:hypothetical protein
LPLPVTLAQPKLEMSLSQKVLCRVVTEKKTYTLLSEYLQCFQ